MPLVGQSRLYDVRPLPYDAPLPLLQFVESFVDDCIIDLVISVRVRKLNCRTKSLQPDIYAGTLFNFTGIFVNLLWCCRWLATAA